jgi:hypothetical protein
MKRKKIASWAGAAATAALLLAAPLAFAQEPPKGPDPSLEGLSIGVAARFADMQKLSARFSKPEAAKELVDVLAARDAAGFNRLFGDLDLSLGGTCWWVHEIVEQAFTVEEPPKDNKECTLKDNLTPAELATYWRIAMKYNVLGGVLNAQGQIVVGPGPFRDELEAAGLLDCKPVLGSANAAARPIVGKPVHFCLEDPPKP